MRRRKGISATLAITVFAGTLLLGAFGAQAQAALRHIDGTVVSKNAGAKTFRISTQGGSRVTVKVNASTDFERIAGNFSGLHKGMKVEVDARTTSSGLVATQVEPKESGGGGGDDGGHGGGGHGGNDDGPNHH